MLGRALIATELIGSVSLEPAGGVVVYPVIGRDCPSSYTIDTARPVRSNISPYL